MDPQTGPSTRIRASRLRTTESGSSCHLHSSSCTPETIRELAAAAKISDNPSIERVNVSHVTFTFFCRLASSHHIRRDSSQVSNSATTSSKERAFEEYIVRSSLINYFSRRACIKFQSTELGRYARPRVNNDSASQFRCFL